MNLLSLLSYPNIIKRKKKSKKQLKSKSHNKNIKNKRQKYLPTNRYNWHAETKMRAKHKRTISKKKLRRTKANRFRYPIVLNNFKSMIKFTKKNPRGCLDHKNHISKKPVEKTHIYKSLNIYYRISPPNQYCVSKTWRDF